MPEENYEALLPFLEPVSLPLGMALYESGGEQGYVYFPKSSIVSLLYVLGVRREGVTEAAGKLQAAGLIEYSRGRITVLNRQQLEARVCECHAVVRKEYDRLLPPAMASSATAA